MRDYPKCHALGVLVQSEHGPRVKPDALKKALPPADWKRWCRWAACITSDTSGIYAWDVEAFLEGRPNED